MKKIRFGIVACIHGNEKIGLEAIKILAKMNPENAQLKFIIANKLAIKLDKRFIDEDLNRVFPGKSDGNHEERLAVEILHELKDCDYVLDIHSTTANQEHAIIITRKNLDILDLATRIPLRKVIIMGPSIAGYKSLIDHVKQGISIEFNQNEDPERVAQIIRSYIRNLKNRTRQSSQEIYLVYGSLPRQGNLFLENFKRTRLGGETFYPIFYGEKEYEKIWCMKAKRIR